MNFLLPTGIGDSVWALHKIQSIAASHHADSINVHLACHQSSTLESRALDFVRRFDFVTSAQMAPGLALVDTPAFTPDGYWNYIRDGFYDFDGDRYCVLIPNAALERGHRLETWLPDHAINWDIFSRFRITAAEHSFAETLRAAVGPYCVFYPGPLDGNTVQGHNRNMLWTPREWIALGEQLHRRYGLHIVVVGAAYDAPYYDALIAPALNGSSGYWTNLIGATTIGELYAITSASQFLISYQAGVGIVSTYLGTPTAIFWRARGDSICQGGYLSFDERMASAWVSPIAIAAGTHLPLIYGRHGTQHILSAIESRGWAV